MKCRIAFMTLGCKVNQYETERLKAVCEKAGYTVVPYDSVADVYVVNTCTVTNIADRKSRKMLHRGKRLNPSAIVVAMGCFADAAKDTLKEDDTIDIIICNADKEKAFDMIDEAVRMRVYGVAPEVSEDDYNNKACDTSGQAGAGQAGKERVEAGQVGIDQVGTDISGTKDSEKEDADTKNAAVNERTRVYIKIQEGCNQFCSYCKIPYVRGKLNSRDPDSVYEEAVQIVSKGIKEVVLTGIHVSSYGVDKSDAGNFTELGGKPLLELIERLAGIDGLARIRLSSLEPRIITEGFIKSLSGIEKVCPHFHLSLQSGCDATLKRMNRKYSTSEYMQACNIIRRYYEDPAITTDIIVGFPGETDEEFETTLKFAGDVGFAAIHVFKYSKRDGTKAAVMPSQVDPVIMNERSSRLISLAEKLIQGYISRFIGRGQDVLVEEIVQIDGKKYHVGHNERYVKIAVPYNEGDVSEGEIVQIIPCGIHDNILL